MKEPHKDTAASAAERLAGLSSAQSAPPGEERCQIWHKSDAHLRMLSADDLVDLMVDDEDRVPRRVIDECVARGDSMLDALESVLDTGLSWSDDSIEGYWWLTLHTIHILGLIPHARAGAMLSRAMIRLLQEDEDPELGDWVLGCWPALFRNKPAQVFEPMHALVEDRTRNAHLRSNLLDVLTAAACRSSAEVLDAQLDVVASLAAQEDEDEALRELALQLLLDFPRERHRKLLEDYAQSSRGRAAAAIKPDDVSRVFADPCDRPEWDSFADPWVFYAPERIAMREARWAEEEDEDPIDVVAIKNLEDLHALIYETPYGRIELCPCGSGKEYKRCCLGLERVREGTG